MSFHMVRMNDTVQNLNILSSKCTITQIGTAKIIAPYLEEVSTTRGSGWVVQSLGAGWINYSDPR